MQGHPALCAGWRPSHRVRLGTGLGRSPELPAASGRGLIRAGWGPRLSAVSPVGWGVLACPPCRGLCPGGAAGPPTLLTSCSSLGCGGTLGVRVWTCSAGRKRESLGRSGSPCGARPAPAPPASACGLGVGSHCPGTHVLPQAGPGPTEQRPRGVVPGVPRAPTPLWGLSAPGCSPDRTASQQ